MNCTKCKAQWTPPQNLAVTKCPFCGEHLFSPKIDSKPAEPYQVLLEIVQQFGRDTLGQSRLKGLLADLMPNAEKRHLRILRQAVDDGIGARLLEMQSDTHAVSMLKITTLKENFRNNNAFNHTADYVVDCFLFALGWLQQPPKEDVNSAQVNTLNILQHTVEMAFADGRLSKEEAKSIFTLAKTLSISEDEANRLIIEKLKAQNYKPEKAIDQTLRSKKEIILSQDWVLKNEVKIEEENESVKIGTQVWMKRNLELSHFRNGDPIPEARTDGEWEKAGREGKPVWCYYENDPENGKIYGKLYNWFAVNDPRGLAPEGWHVPSDEEWNVLVDFLGGNKIAGGKMKSTGTSKWYSPNEGATNSSGFSGLPGGGYRATNGYFLSLGNSGVWWSSTEFSSTHACNHDMYPTNDFVPYDFYHKGNGFSVRCLRDDATVKNIASTFNEKNELDSAVIGNQELMKRSLDVSNFQYYDPKPKATKNEIDQNRTGNRCYPRIGGNEGFGEMSVGSFIDSSPFNFHKATTRVIKSGENAGRVYFVAPKITAEGRNGCFTMDEIVSLELEYEGLGLVGGEKGVDEKGMPYIENPFLNLAREVVGQKVNGVLKVVE